MTTRYTTRFRFNKPDFRTSPWSALINENSDKLDEIIYNVLQASSIGLYETDVELTAGQIIYDASFGSLWINGVTHTTKATGTFADERVENPTYWTSLNLGVEIKGQWQPNTYYAANAMAYDANEGLTGICKDEHTSALTGSMRDEIDKWNVIFDIEGGGGTPATEVAYDDTAQSFTAVNVQVALDETNTRIDNAATTVSGALTDIAALQTDVDTAQDDIDTLQNFATSSDVYGGTANKVLTANNLWTAAQLVDLGNVSGIITLNFANGLNFKMTLTGDATLANPNNLKVGQSFGLYIIQDGTGSHTLSFGTQWLPIGAIEPTIGSTANRKNYLSGQRLDSTSIAYSGGRIGS